MSKNNPSRVVRIGSGLGEAIKGELVKCLQSHAYIFAWSHEDMPGIDPGVAQAGNQEMGKTGEAEKEVL